MTIENIIIAKQYFETRRACGRLKTREQIEKYQDQKVKELLKEVLPDSKFYREFYAGLDTTDWRNLPTISKQEWMDRFDDVNTKGIRKEEAFDLAVKAEKTRDFKPQIGRVTVGLSSGTSGNRGLWLVSLQERYRWAGSMLAKTLPDSIFAKERIAFFMRADSNLYSTMGSARLSFRFFDLLDPIEQHVALLNDYQPTILSAPPSALKLLSKELESKRLAIRPKKVVSVADVLTDEDKSYAEQAFGTKIHQVYQATEGFIAVTCKEGNLHLNEDLVAVQKEYIDKDSGRFEPIITDLSRTTQPIIRYRLNDILIEEEKPCACGSPFTRLKKIEGRSDDILYFKSLSGDKVIPIFPDFIRNAIITGDETVNDYLVKQRKDSSLDIYLANAPSDRLKESIDAVFSRSRCKVPSIIYHTPVPERARTDKIRRIMHEKAE